MPTPISELDFFQIKQQLKSFLKTQTQFKDYNFEGANLSVLLDVLAYNTYQNNFYTNMAISEMFLDSAQVESTVLSHAKELNYLPKSAVSAVAEVNLVITSPSTVGLNFNVPKNTKFTSTYNGITYSFYTVGSVVATRQQQTSLFVVKGVPIYEGEIVTEKFIVDEQKSYQMTNDSVDTSSIIVTVDGIEYTFTSNISGVQPNDKVFYLESGHPNGYAVTFGRDLFGREPTRGEQVVVTYRVASGSSPNGASKFSASIGTSVVVQTVSVAGGGDKKETIDSIKFAAPKSIQTQERAVTARDYETLLMRQFGSKVIKSVSVYGGDIMVPPRYGKVAISVNPHSGNSLSAGFKTSIISYLSDKVPMPIQPIFVDPEYMYANIHVNAYFSTKLSSKTPSEISDIIKNAIMAYNESNLDDFGTTLKISRLSKIIDDLDVGITSNTIDANPIIDFSPAIGTVTVPVISFGSGLLTPYKFSEAANIANYVPSIRSSIYTFNGIDVFFQDDGEGNIMLLNSNLQDVQVVNPSIGRIDYTTGQLKLSSFTNSGYEGNSIKIYANTIDQNIIAPKNRVFSIRESDITITVKSE